MHSSVPFNAFGTWRLSSSVDICHSLMHTSLAAYEYKIINAAPQSNSNTQQQMFFVQNSIIFFILVDIFKELSVGKYKRPSDKT